MRITLAVLGAAALLTLSGCVYEDYGGGRWRDDDWDRDDRDDRWDRDDRDDRDDRWDRDDRDDDWRGDNDDRDEWHFNSANPNDSGPPQGGPPGQTGEHPVFRDHPSPRR